MAGMLHITNEFTRRVITALFFGSLFLGIFFLLPPIYFTLLFICIALYCSFYELPHLLNTHSRAFWLTVPLYPIMPCALIILLNHTHHALLFLLFAMVFAFDTGAYCAGRLFGKHTIAPRISPKKSWEGLVGGYALCMSAFLLFARYMNAAPTMQFTLIFCALVSIVATCGDFFESWLKRRAGVKDSGTLLPGHGGLLDRFDAVFFVVILFYLLRNYLVTL